MPLPRPFRVLVTAVVLVFLLAMSATVAPTPAYGQDDAPAPEESTPEAPGEPAKKKKKNNQAEEPAPATTVAPEPSDDEAGNLPPAEGEPTLKAAEGEPVPGAENADADAAGDGVVQPIDTRPKLSIQELLRLQALYDEAVGDEAEALALWEIASARLDQINGRVARAEGMLAWTELELGVARDARTEAVDARVAAEDELERVKAELADEIARLKRQAVEAFIGGSGSNEDILSTVLNAGSIDEVESVRKYAHVALDDQEMTITNIEHLEVRVDELVGDKEANEKLANEALRQVEGYEREIAARNVEIALLLEQASAEEDERRRQLAEVQTRRTDYEQRLNALEQDSDSASAALIRAQANQPSGPPPRLHSPLLAAEISSGFGPRMHPIWGNVRMHNGLDYGGDSGDQIFAAAAGVVVMAELRGGYGNVVVIDHGEQWGTLYAHQSQVNVVPGQQVARGDVIGWVGSTGHSTGPHLHFELRQLGDPRDPSNHIDHDELHPVECEVLIRTGHRNDLNEAQRRDDCAEYFEQD